MLGRARGERPDEGTVEILRVGAELLVGTAEVALVDLRQNHEVGAGHVEVGEAVAVLDRVLGGGDLDERDGQ